ncbi:MAG: hypothetical protein QXV61_03070, partial [Archaeoglobaceae archaeon]
EIAYMIPLTHFLEFYRSFYNFPASSDNPALMGFLLSFVLLFFLFLILVWALDRARRKGTITQFSE